MSFVDAVKSVLSKYATFSGRARRSEYWFWALAAGILGILVSVLDRSMSDQPGQIGIVSIIVSLALFLPGLAVAVRRLHDTGRSGWWVLIALVPFVGAIVLLVFTVQDSQADNEYGPSPKQVDAAPAFG